MIDDLFTDQMETQLTLSKGAVWLRGFALPDVDAIYKTLTRHFEAFPPQQMMTKMGGKMSVRTTSLGQFGWVSTENGYGYAPYAFTTQQQWPAIPNLFLRLAGQAAANAGYAQFVPDTCLVNVYEVGSKMGLHQDKNEQDFSQPIVSVSLGLPADFQFGGSVRSDKVMKVPLTHGDVVVWGAESRLCFHGVLPLKAGVHPLLGPRRINLTFRKAGKM